MLAWENFASRPDTIFCGVFDGHGPYGHMVAKKVRDALPLKLSQHLDLNISREDVLKEISINATGSVHSEDNLDVSANEESMASIGLEGTDIQPEMFKKMKESFLKAFKVMDRELRMHATLDCFCSGTTAVTLCKQGKDIFIGNVGDSRAVLGTRDKDGTLVAIQLTVDLKPNLPAEEERIRKCKGRVFALQDEPEVARVWLPNNDSPGLAMARAFGDFCLKDFGLIAVPEISYKQVNERDQFIVLATDGIWDVLSNDEVVHIVASAPSQSSAARLLVESAVRAWRYKYPTSKVDDCAVVCLFLNTDQNPSSTASSTKRQIQSTSEEQVVAGNEDDATPVPTSLDRSGTVRTGNETLPEGTQEDDPEIESKLEMGTEWSALEGVSRVNTLINMPRFTHHPPGMQSFCGSSSYYPLDVSGISDTTTTPQDRALLALKNHKEAEKRRRERINSHLDKLRSILPCNSKTDKASLLAKVVQRVRELKQQTSEITELDTIPSETDEITVIAGDYSSDGRLIFKASLCCEDRSDLMPELTEILKSLHLKTLRAEMATLGGRIRNVLVVAADKEHSIESVHFLQNALKSLLERSTSGTDRSKRRRMIDHKMVL